MSFMSDTRQPAAGTTTTTITNPLRNLSEIQSNINSIQKVLSHSVNTNTALSQPQLNLISSQITSFLHQTILNATSLLPSIPNNDIIEMDALELLAEHVHFCQICGKGFKRDANLRMHMRAHGNRFKTVEALFKPAGSRESSSRFSCPYVGCNRNKLHGKFRPLKSVVCLRNHFKRSHCPKMYWCDKCKNKSFSVIGDLKAHMKGCGEERKWKCCCGTSFSRKDKLFGHVALFEGHMPVVMEEEEEEEGKGKGMMETYDDLDLDMGIEEGSSKNEDLDRFFEGCGEIDEGFSSNNSVGFGMEGFFNF